MDDPIFNIYLHISIALLLLLALKILFFMSFSYRHHRKRKERRTTTPTILSKEPLVSLIIPCYNESLTVENCVRSIVRQTYKNFEILLVNDGSTDSTERINRRMAHKYSAVRSFSKKNGGKASALNHGIRYSHGSIVVCMDADSAFMPDAVEKLVASFDSPDIAAVGGNVRVANRQRILSKHQAVEYITGLTIQRRAFAELECMQVISGAIGAFRKDRLIEAGGFSKDTIVEDMDITIELSRRGYRVVYCPDAIAYTEAPEDIRAFMKQRYRWAYGGLQVVNKHRDIIFRKKYGRIATIGLPYFLIFPWVDVMISIFLFLSIAMVIHTGEGWGLLVFYLFMSFIQGSLLMYALVVDGENKKLIFLAGIDSLFYNHLISFITLLAGVNFITKKKVLWNKLERRGRNILPFSRFKLR